MWGEEAFALRVHAVVSVANCCQATMKGQGASGWHISFQASDRLEPHCQQRKHVCCFEIEHCPGYNTCACPPLCARVYVCACTCACPPVCARMCARWALSSFSSTGLFRRGLRGQEPGTCVLHTTLGVCPTHSLRPQAGARGSETRAGDLAVSLAVCAPRERAVLCLCTLYFLCS